YCNCSDGSAAVRLRLRRRLRGGNRATVRTNARTSFGSRALVVAVVDAVGVVIEVGAGLRRGSRFRRRGRLGFRTDREQELEAQVTVDEVVLAAGVAVIGVDAHAGF